MCYLSAHLPLQDNHLRLSHGMILDCVFFVTWRASTVINVSICQPIVSMDGSIHENISNRQIELITKLMLGVEHNGSIEYRFLMEGLCSATLGLCCNRAH
jgi:hypothetical protein